MIGVKADSQVIRIRIEKKNTLAMVDEARKILHQELDKIGKVNKKNAVYLTLKECFEKGTFLFLTYVREEWSRAQWREHFGAF